MTDNPDILFVGWGGPEGVTHYRTILPAKTMGAEWVVIGMDGRPVCGEGSRKDHRVIIIQNCWYDWQLKIVQRMLATGATCLFNVDDYIKGIGKRDASHGNASVFRDRDVLRTHQRIWESVHGAIVSTPWLEQKLSSHNPNIRVARNGIDPGRYTPWMDVERDMGTIVGWAGGTGHREALATIAGPVSEVIKAHEGTMLWIVGQDESDLFDCPKYYVPWSDMHLYPAKLACFDINLAPAREDDFYRGKSQLRLYEALTLGTPSIVHPMYDEVGNAGIIARDAGAWGESLDFLLNNPESLQTLRTAAHELAKGVTIDARIGEWERAIADLARVDG